MLMLATVIVALACEKGAPLSNGTANSAGPVATPSTVAPSVGASSVGASSIAASSAALTVATPSGAEPVREPSKVAAAVAPAAAKPAAGTIEEGNGEPMDDVDDEEVSATDKSGAGNVADEAPSGPVDDSEGADIELRE
ncbi:MAG TPA: hypothetical protein VMG12_23695 [Polyangiaceae bacterium]|nr:hypothetical protein [Polyangiaceae bacterium]